MSKKKHYNGNHNSPENLAGAPARPAPPTSQKGRETSLGWKLLLLWLSPLLLIAMILMVRGEC